MTERENDPFESSTAVVLGPATIAAMKNVCTDFLLAITGVTDFWRGVEYLNAVQQPKLKEKSK